MKSFYERIMHIDRRIIYAIIMIVVLIPLIWSLNLKTYHTEPITKIYNRLEQNHKNAKKNGVKPKPVFMCVTYGGSAKPELHPMTRSVLRHCYLRGIPVISFAFEPEAAKIAEDIMDEVAFEYGAVYGKDYACFGFKYPPLPLILGLGTNAKEALKEDVRGNKYEDIPVMHGIRTYDDIDLLFDFSASASWMTWVVYAKSRFNQDIAVGLTGVMVSQAYPYLETGQLVGILTGLKGAAEYEDYLMKMEKETEYSSMREKNLKVYLTLTQANITPTSKNYVDIAERLLRNTPEGEFEKKLKDYYDIAQNLYYKKYFAKELSARESKAKNDAEKKSLLNDILSQNQDKVKELDYLFLKDFKKKYNDLLATSISENKRAMVGMDAQAIAHVVIILFILIGNIGFFLSKWR
ncbi:MAG: hypothetical protein JXA60_07255 [Candidatus Coatesbacteria bacterium]|nr:hypothetical protein [Candidatus Coatesbacteria bacterium]